MMNIMYFIHNVNTSSLGNVDSIPLMEGEGRTLRVLGFNHAQRALFLQTLNRYGFQNYDWKEYLPRLKGKSVDEIQRYAELVMAHLVEDINDSDYFSDGVPKEGMRVDDVLVRIANISLIEEKVAAMGQGKNTNLFPNYLLCEFQGLSGGRIWKTEHDLLLLKGILKHGYARWQYISDDRDNGLFEAARRELNLPSINEIIGAQLNNVENGNLEGAQEGEVNTAGAHYKEIQRKIVEFLRKRYHILERCLDLEYAVIKSNTPVPDDIAEQGIPAGHAPAVRDINELLVELQELQNLEPIPTNEVAPDGTGGQSQVPYLYNKMCGVLEDSGASALNSFFGVKSASSSLANSLHQFETLCEGVVQALQPQQNGTASAIKEEAVDANSKEAAAAPPQDSGPEAANGELSTAKPDMMEIDG
jgi:chromodomain-helicase-DNA-binding protein 4